MKTLGKSPWRVVAAVGVALTMRAAPARACSPQLPGLFGRAVWPAADRRPPTNARFVVSYGVSAPSERFPAFGPDLVLLAGDGAAPPIEVELIEVPEGQISVVIRPSAPLQANTTYQIADRRIVPCDPLQGQCALTQQATAFATFTTAATVDSLPPAFTGVTSLTLNPRESCSGGGCCSEYDAVPVDLGWDAGTDDVAGSDLRYNVYRLQGGGAPPLVFARFIDATTFRGYQTCHGQHPGTSIAPGSYMVRAVDWAGHEESNGAVRRLGDACESGLSCAVSGPIPSHPPGWSPIGADAGLAFILMGIVLVARSRFRHWGGRR